MDFRRSILRVSALAALSLLASCIDGREEIWINADGSGRADITYSLPAAAAGFQGGESGVRRMIEEFLRDAPGISGSTCETATDGDRMNIRVRTNFESVLELRNVSTSHSMSELPSSATGLTGEFQVERRGMSVDFARTIRAGEALPGSGLIPVSRFKDRRLTYIVHLPKAATSSNATRTENSGRTLVWDYPLAQAIQEPVTTRFTAPVPLPRWAVAGIWLTGAVTTVVIVRKFVRPKARTA